MSVVPKPYPSEFRDDVIAVAWRREGGVTLARIAKDRGMTELSPVRAAAPGSRREIDHDVNLHTPRRLWFASLL
jgi:hypothetical protein